MSPALAGGFLTTGPPGKFLKQFFFRFSDITGIFSTSELFFQDFPGGPVVKNPPANAGDTGSIPGPGTKIPTSHTRGN